MKHTELKIEGMNCAACVASVQRALEGLPGVSVVFVDLPGGRATVEHEETVSPATLAAAVHEAGYDAETRTA